MGYILGKPLKNFQTLDIVRRGGGGQWYRRTFYQGGGEGLIIEKKQVNFKVHFGLFKAFLDHVFVLFFSLRGVGEWVRTLNGKFH